ncbi:MAG: hypothetical protein FD165_945 [Gammaproteobacteria bacterium]|nr:MAG: hypothetical protein FD165_945 [Gammaproteobacteria bacterium]TND06346.1 MAG: hypothetical protein FD120_833 [Gammaproteobacteria bacterium]
MTKSHEKPLMRPTENPGARGLPEPDAEALAHSRRLEAVIRREIEDRGGYIDFARFMELALYAPGLGYYSAGLPKFGAAGDFVTAPELSPLFARCVARQCAQVLALLGGGDVLEAGAGTGLLASGVLQQLQALDCLPDRYFILETSADLRERQRRCLQELPADLAARVQWLDSLPPGQFRGVVLANEVLDAMPVQRFRRTSSGVDELMVAVADDRLVWYAVPAHNPRLVERVAGIEQAIGARLPEGYESELHLAAEGWIASVADSLEAGMVLIVDYGYPRREYYHPERSSGTLRCHYRHHAHDDPLRLVGLQDITSHVDFTAVAETAVAAGMGVAGYTTQAYFLFATGITAFAQEGEKNDRQRLATAQQIKRLTMPGEMGEVFKVIALTKGIHEPLTGFQWRDLRQKL